MTATPPRRRTELLAAFVRRFNTRATVLASAPGRVNILGEHVDYNDGVVLPFAIPARIHVAAAPAADAHLTAFSAQLNAAARFPTHATEPNQPHTWSNYLRGAVALLRASGAPLPTGAYLYIAGDLPPGAGLSSSAALSVATLLALSALARVQRPPLELVRLAQRSEHEFAHTPCGIMDPFVSVFARARHILQLDCRTLTHNLIPLAFADHAWLLLPSGVNHTLASGAYADRVAACRRVVDHFRTSDPQIAALRDVSRAQLEHARPTLAPTDYRRARHVISEIERVHAATGALHAADADALGALLNQTQDSLRDDYAVSCSEIDELCNLLRNQPGVCGARMIGGGFGGNVLALIHTPALAAVTHAAQQNYYRPRGLPLSPRTVTPSAGATWSSLSDHD